MTVFKTHRNKQAPQHTTHMCVITIWPPQTLENDTQHSVKSQGDSKESLSQHLYYLRFLVSMRLVSHSGLVCKKFAHSFPAAWQDETLLLNAEFVNIWQWGVTAARAGGGNAWHLFSYNGHRFQSKEFYCFQHLLSLERQCRALMLDWTM